MFGNETSSVVEVPCVVYMGQSHCDGAFQSERLANTLWNYKGILAGYPNTRTTQEQYVADPAGVHIWNRSAAQASDWSLDTGAWEPYEAGVNSRNVTTASNTVLFGPECFVSQGIADHTGGEVAIIKPAFAGVGLLPTTITVAPGPWNNNSKHIALQNYIRAGVRDWAAYNPGTRLKLVGVVWWQGEAEVGSGTSGASYVADLLKLYTFLNEVFQSYFVLDRLPSWHFVSLDSHRNATEGGINTAVEAFADARSNCYFIDDHKGKSLRKSELTAAQDDPLTKGSPTNASGNDDDSHCNYIAGQLVGERIVSNMIAGEYI